MLKQYLGSPLKPEIFYKNKNTKVTNLKKLNRSFHLPKTSYTSHTSQAITPQLKKMLEKTSKLLSIYFDSNLLGLDERNFKNSTVNKSQKIEETLWKKFRDSFSSPIHIGKPKIERPKSPDYKIFKSVSAVEACDDGKDLVYDEENNIVTKFAFATRVGHAPNNPNKVNQDSFILAPNILNMQSMHYFGVCDGHGQNGKDVSTLIKQKLPALLEEYLYNSKLNIRESLSKSFIDCNKLLMTNKKFDVHLSGST